MYPSFRRWINQCVACQRQGYDPKMPDEARGARNIRRYFPPLAVNSQRLCEQCVNAQDRESPPGAPKR